MIRLSGAPWLLWLTTGIQVLGCAQAATLPAGAGIESRARQLASSQYATDVAVAGAALQAAGLEPKLNAEVLAGEPIGMRLWRFSATASNYLVGQRGDSLFRLGGFPAPELAAAVRASGVMAGWDQEAASTALATLLDPNGAYDVVLVPLRPERAVASDVLTSWLNQMPTGWPARVYHQDAMGALLSFTVLSRAAGTFDDSWVPIAYVFLFSPKGELQAWSSRTGTAIR